MIFGSTALRYWFPESRQPRDLDIATQSTSGSTSIEHHWIPSFSKLQSINGYVVPSHLMTIKLAHLNYDINWDKHMHDFLLLQRHKVTPDYELLPLLQKDFADYHGSKRVNLNKPLDQFFTSTVTRRYNHDELHELLAHYNRPLHERIRPDLSKAYCSRDLFFALGYNDQCLCALEEAYVITYERFLSRSYMPFKHAKAAALKLMITNLTSGWFNQFLIENFFTLLSIEPTPEIKSTFLSLEYPYDKRPFC